MHSHESAEGLGVLPREVDMCLRRSGWVPGRRRRQWRHFDEFSNATAVLDEVYGLELSPLRKAGPFSPINVSFTIPARSDRSTPFVFEQSEIDKLAGVLGVAICPLAYADRGNQVLFICNNEYVLGASMACFGGYIVGASIGDALLRVLTGEAVLPLWVDHSDTTSFAFCQQDPIPPNGLEHTDCVVLDRDERFCWDHIALPPLHSK